MGWRGVVALSFLWGTACLACSTEVELSSWKYITKDNAPAVLGFASEGEAYQLLKCNTAEDFLNYRFSIGNDLVEGAGSCYQPIARSFTPDDLHRVRQKIASDLSKKNSATVSRLGFSIGLAAASILISKAIVEELIKVIPITVATGLVLYYSHRKLATVTQFQREKATILAYLCNLDASYSSPSSLAIVEEVLIKYLNDI